MSNTFVMMVLAASSRRIIGHFVLATLYGMLTMIAVLSLTHLDWHGEVALMLGIVAGGCCVADTVDSLLHLKGYVVKFGLPHTKQSIQTSYFLTVVTSGFYLTLILVIVSYASVFFMVLAFLAERIMTIATLGKARKLYPQLIER